MTKAMLLLDMPNSCIYCPCAGPGKTNNEIVCRAEGQLVSVSDRKPSWCPLIFLDMNRMDSIIKALNDPLNLHTNPAEYVKRKCRMEGV